MKNIGSIARVSGLCVVVAWLAAGCASKSPAPVVGREGQPLATAAAAAKDVYVVKSGDTLYSIAREHGMDFRELVALNGIENPNHIVVGRTLKVRPPSTATTAPIVSPVVVAQPIAPESAIEQRPLGSASTSANTELRKTEPRAGKEPYSEQALAAAQGQATTAPPKAAEAPAAKPEAKPAEAAAGEARTWLWPADGKIIGTYGEHGNKGVDVAGKAGDPVVVAQDGKVILANNTLRGYGNMVIVKHSDTLISVYAHNSKLLVKEGQSVSKGQKIAEMGSSDADQVKLHFEVRAQGKPVDPLKYLPAR